MPFTSTQSPLARLQELFSLLDFVSHHIAVDQDNPFEQVLVALDDDLEDDADPRYVMQIFFAEDVMRASGVPEMQEGLDNSATLQFMLETPISVAGLPPARLIETYKALNLFTQMMPLGNFGLNSDGNIYFRYGMMGPDKNMNATLVSELIGLFGFFISQLGPLLEDFVTSDKTVETLLEETGFHKAFAGMQPQG